MARYVFGIDVGGTTVKCGLFTEEGSVIDKWEITTRTENNGAAIIPDVADTVLEKMKERRISREEVDGLGIGIPGPVAEDGTVLVAVNLHWGRKDVAAELQEKLGFPVKVGNDANVAALGEMWMGGGKGARSLIMVTLGTGVGGGIIVDGKIVVGAHGAGGEIGHACVNPEETETCNCGNQGCLEQYASATGLVRLAKEELAAFEGTTVLEAGSVTAKDVWDAYKEGDEAACRIVKRFSGCLGNALAIFSCVVDPEVFVIGGGVSKAGDVLIRSLEESYRRCAFKGSKETPMVLAQLGNDAGIFGAARLALADR